MFGVSRASRRMYVHSQQVAPNGRCRRWLRPPPVPSEAAEAIELGGLLSTAPVSAQPLLVEVVGARVHEVRRESAARQQQVAHHRAPLRLHRPIAISMAPPPTPPAPTFCVRQEGRHADERARPSPGSHFIHHFGHLDSLPHSPDGVASDGCGRCERTCEAEEAVRAMEEVPCSSSGVTISAGSTASLNLRCVSAVRHTTPRLLIG